MSQLVGWVGDGGNPDSPFADIRVRRAIEYATDKATIVKTIFRGYHEVANQPVSATVWAYNPAVVGYPYNPQKAKELLTQAGYPNGFKTRLIIQGTAGAVTSTTDFAVAVQGFLIMLPGI